MSEQTTTPENRSYTGEKIWTEDSFPVLRAAFTLPQAAGNTAAARRFCRFYRAQGRAFLRYCGSFLLPEAQRLCREALAASRPLPELRAELTYCDTFCRGDLRSLYTQIEIRAGGDVQLLRWGDTWDLSAGFPLPMKAFFLPGVPLRRTVLSYAIAEIRRRREAGLLRCCERWPQRLRRSFHTGNFYLTERGLTVFFPMYTLSAGGGITTVTLPWETPGLRPPGCGSAGGPGSENACP